MLLPIPHYRQEEEKTCVPASARIVLAFQGMECSESELAVLLGTDGEGTQLDSIVSLIAWPGVAAATIDELSLAELEAYLMAGMPIIVYLWTEELSNWTFGTAHAAVVVGMDGHNIYLNDPYFEDAPQAIHHAEFERAWREMGNLAAVIVASRP